MPFSFRMWTTDFEILTGNGLAPTIWVLFPALILVVFMVRHRKIAQTEKECFTRLAEVGFQSNSQLHSLDKSIAISISPSASGKPFRRGLLLIGGFGDPPHIWEGIAERASKAGWYALAPRTPGWGRTNFNEAKNLSWTDWVLACRDALVMIRGICVDVTIVAHSTGAPVAAMVIELFPVERLILTGPNFVSNPRDLWGRRLVLTPFVGPLVSAYFGTIPKKKRQERPVDNLNTELYKTGFYLTCFPVHTLREMCLLQEQLSRKWKVLGEVVMLMGDSDQSVGPLEAQAAAVRKFVPENIPFRHLRVPNAAHGLPTETEGVVDTLAGIVLQDVAVLDKLVHLNEKGAGGVDGATRAIASDNSTGHASEALKKSL